MMAKEWLKTTQISSLFTRNDHHLLIPNMCLACLLEQTKSEIDLIKYTWDLQISDALDFEYTGSARMELFFLPRKRYTGIIVSK